MPVRRTCGCSPSSVLQFPFRCCGFPRVRLRDRASAHTPKQVPEEHDLCERGDYSGYRHKSMHGEKRSEELEVSEVRITARIARNACQVHRKKQAVDPDESDSEMELSQHLVE